MLTSTQLDQILNAATRAPSGHNYQPWLFRNLGETLQIFLKPRSDTTIYNYDERGSLVALGAATESINIYSPTIGLRTDHRYLFNREHGDNLVAELNFSKSTQPAAPYANALLSRTTNRKKYSSKNIPDDVLKTILETLDEIDTVQTYPISDPVKRAAIAKILTVTDSLMLEHPAVRDAIFPHIVWTKQEEEQRRTGLYIKTLELPLPAEKIFGLFARYQALADFAGRIGFGKVIATQNATLYSTGGTFVLLTIPDLSDRSFFELGRSLQRIWTSATHHSLAAQPIAAMLFLAERARVEKPAIFSETVQQHLFQAQRQVAELFSVPSSEIPAMVIRMGYADPPSATSSRKKPHLLS